MQVFHKLIIPRYLQISRSFSLDNDCVGGRWRDGNPKKLILTLTKEVLVYHLHQINMTLKGRKLPSHPLFKPKGTDYTQATTLSALRHGHGNRFQRGMSHFFDMI